MFVYYKTVIGPTGDQLDELLASLTASCRVYLLSSLYCILLIARQININDCLID